MKFDDGPELQRAIASDADRVVREYERRATDRRLREYYERVGPAVARAAADRHRRILAVIDSLGSRESIRVLDVGCGRGDDLAALKEAGLQQGNLAGADLLATDIDVARARMPDAQLMVGNAAALPLSGGTFDIVMQTVMLSSVVDPVVRRSIAREMERLVRPTGRLISYDLTGGGNRNPHLVRVEESELRRLFSDPNPRIERVTLYLPIASRVSPWLGDQLSRIPWLRRHLFAVMERP